jgi:uncharacterized membrane protein YhhN
MPELLLPAFLTGAAAVSAVLCIRAALGRQARRVYVFKPLATALLLACALALQPFAGVRYQLLVAVGLIASLAGDVFLMLPRDRFLAGMVSFLLAHLVYIAAFAGRSTLHVDWPSTFILLAFGVSFVALLWSGLGAFRIPVLVYVAVILLMAAVAVAQWRTLGGIGPALAAIGALTFVASDAALAWDRFRRPLPAAPAIVLGAYYAAQALIAWSVHG